MKFNIKDAAGNVVNTILANTDFVEANFEHYELYVAPTPAEPSAEEDARQWRDGELTRTDIAATVSDYPNAEAILAYRQALRDWPSTDAFPDTRPEV